MVWMGTGPSTRMPGLGTRVHTSHLSAGRAHGQGHPQSGEHSAFQDKSPQRAEAWTER